MSDLTNYYQKKALNYGISGKRSQKLLSILKDQVKNKKVLELGCSTGYFGAILKSFGANVVGVDISDEAISQAKKVLNKALTLDLNKDPLPFFANEFDFVIASEVIEHLFEPVDLLKKVSKIIKNDGKFILTTPNFLYWGNRVKFLIGDFKYQDSGVFDRTHIHFYTYKTLMEDLRTAGFGVVKESHVFLGLSFLENIKSKFPGLFAYQFVVITKKK